MDVYLKTKLMIGFLYFLQTVTCIQGYEYKYIGCFKDRKHPNRALPVNHKSYFGNTAEYCVGRCGDEGYSYFGLAEGVQCWCGNAGYNRYGPSQHCYYPCTGNFSQICGAIHRNSVYEVVYATTTSNLPTLTTSTKRKMAIPDLISSSTTVAAPKETSTSNTFPPQSSQLQNGSVKPALRNSRGTRVNIGITVGMVIGCVIIALVVALAVHQCPRKLARGFACDNEESSEPPSSTQGCVESMKQAAARTDAAKYESGRVYNAYTYTILPQRPKPATHDNAECTVLDTSTYLETGKDGNTFQIITST